MRSTTAGVLQEYWEKANLFDHHIMWHECLYDIEDSEFRNAMGRYDGSMTRVRLLKHAYRCCSHVERNAALHYCLLH